MYVHATLYYAGLLTVVRRHVIMDVYIIRPFLLCSVLLS